MEPTKIFASPCQRAGALEAEGRGRHGHELLLVVADLGRNQLDRARLLLFFFLFVIIKVIPSLGGPVPRTSGGRDDVEELVEDDLGGLDELHVVPADGEDVVPDLDGEGALLLRREGRGRELAWWRRSFWRAACPRSSCPTPRWPCCCSS